EPADARSPAGPAPLMPGFRWRGGCPHPRWWGSPTRRSPRPVSAFAQRWWPRAWRSRPAASPSISRPPTCRRKGHYDLPIALGLMAAIGAIPADALSAFTVLGELGLDGSIAAVAGVLPAAIRRQCP